MINEVLQAALDKIRAAPREEAVSIANDAVEALYDDYGAQSKHSVEEFERLMDAEQLIYEAVRLRMDGAYEKAYREVSRIRADKKKPDSDTIKLLTQLNRVVIFCERNGLFDDDLAFDDDEEKPTLTQIVQEAFSELLGSRAKSD